MWQGRKVRGVNSPNGQRKLKAVNGTIIVTPARHNRDVACVHVCVCVRVRVCPCTCVSVHVCVEVLQRAGKPHVLQDAEACLQICVYIITTCLQRKARDVNKGMHGQGSVPWKRQCLQRNTKRSS